MIHSFRFPVGAVFTAAAGIIISFRGLTGLLVTGNGAIGISAGGGIGAIGFLVAAFASGPGSVSQSIAIGSTDTIAVALRETQILAINLALAVASGISFALANAIAITNALVVSSFPLFSLATVEAVFAALLPACLAGFLGSALFRFTGATGASILLA